MQSYTKEFGYYLWEPEIISTCEVLSNELAWGIRKSQTTSFVLVMEFAMQYESSFGFDVGDYPNQFMEFVNRNLDKVAQDLSNRFLPVMKANRLLMYNKEELISSINR